MCVCAWIGAASAPTAASSVLLDVSGAKDGAVSVGLSVPNDAIGTTFTTTGNVSVASIAFDLRCFTSCGGEVVLVQGIPGPEIPVRAFIQRDQFSFDSGGTKTLSGLFEGVDLVANTTYSIVLALSSGNAIWAQNLTPVLVENGIRDGFDFVTEELDANASYRSPFTESGGHFDYTISGKLAAPQPPAIPLPASGAMMLSAVALGLWVRRRRI